MPRQNRVTPFGRIVATAERGTMMGNRGVLHDDAGRIRRDWQVRRWILCRLAFKGRRRAAMTPNRYTELFFLDEATGLAAGHRPCAECRRERFRAFLGACAAGLPGAFGAGPPSADALDSRLHAERLGPDRSKRVWPADPDGLPDGVMIALEGMGDRAFLLRGDALLPWSPGGYGDPLPRLRGGLVSVLTPESAVAAIRAGYAPEVHPSAGRVRLPRG